MTKGRNVREAWSRQIREKPTIEQWTDLDARIDAAIADEREACARLFDDKHSGMRWLCLDNGYEEADAIAAAIRARKESSNACTWSPVSSRVCERGVGGCDERHRKE